LGIPRLSEAICDFCTRLTKPSEKDSNMAKLIQAIAAYGPRIRLMEAATPRRFMDLITKRTTLSAGVVKNVQESEVETLIGLLQEGRPVHTGVAIFTPIIDAKGNLSVRVRMDKRITAALNVPGAFTGKVGNSANLGLDSGQLADLWDGDHPDDPIDR
jgi:lysophospholipase L1-like esterase